MSELVVDGRCLVAFLVVKDEAISSELMRSECELLQAGLVKAADCFVSYLKVLRSSLLKHTFLCRPDCGIAPEGLPCSTLSTPAKRYVL